LVANQTNQTNRTASNQSDPIGKSLTNKVSVVDSCRQLPKGNLCS
jgi:hypothetical protein